MKMSLMYCELCFEFAFIGLVLHCNFIVSYCFSYFMCWGQVYRLRYALFLVLMPIAVVVPCCDRCASWHCSGRRNELLDHGPPLTYNLSTWRQCRNKYYHRVNKVKFV